MDDFHDFPYLHTRSHLSYSDQEERFLRMHEREIRQRAEILRNLSYEKDEVKERIKSYIAWGFDFLDVPGFYRSVDSIVDDVYKRA